MCILQLLLRFNQRLGRIPSQSKHPVYDPSQIERICGGCLYLPFAHTYVVARSTDCRSLCSPPHLCSTCRADHSPVCQSTCVTAFEKYSKDLVFTVCRRKHSSRMRTARLLTGGWCCPGGGGTWREVL